MKKFIPTAEKVEVSDYPYGRLRCTLFDSMDFDLKKGYRHVTQTINPKTSRLNNPKKSTYDNLLIRYYNEDNHIKTLRFSFNGLEELNAAAKFINENFDLFTDKEKSYFYYLAVSMSKISMQAINIYSGSKVEDLIPLFDPFVKNMVAGIKNPSENFFNVSFDIEAINKTKIKDYRPFKIASSQPINILDM